MKKLVVNIGGDSGDGIQLLGNLFTDNIALQNYDLHTFPDFPAEIRAPAGTVNGVSGFQIQYGGEKTYTAGQSSDVLIAFNAASLKKQISQLSPNGILIYDPIGFNMKHCRLANFAIEDLDKITQKKLAVEFSNLTKESLKEFELTDKERDHNKNLFVLGVLSFAIESDLEIVNNLLKSKFGNKTSYASMSKALYSGYYYAETIEFSIDKIESTKSSKQSPHKNITGNRAIAQAIMAAPKIFGRNVVYAGYPITPASDILHELAKYNLKEIICRQAEDEIAAAGMALGAAFGGSIGITSSSGPGIDLKQETIGLAVMAEMPLLIINVQRAGPSTGMPTKVEQSDLNAALYGRHGDCEVPVVSIKTVATAYDKTIEAIKISIKYQTPVFLLSDVLIANGSELWDIPEINTIKINTEIRNPYERNELGVRPWVNLGDEGQNYIAGGLEKDSVTGGISYEAINHQTMTDIRQSKIKNIVNDISENELEEGSAENGNLIISWGSTFGSVKEAFLELNSTNKSIAHLHLEWINPLPKNFSQVVESYDNIIIPELNNGQLAHYLSDKVSKKIHSITQVKGIPFMSTELRLEIEKHLI